MKATKILCIWVLVLSLCGISLLPYEVIADETGPEISNVYHTPKYPIYGESVDVHATVTDPDGIDWVRISYCDEFMCYAPVTMTDPDLDDVYTGTILWHSNWDNGTVVGYEVQARDTLLNLNTTHKTYFTFVSSINVSAEIEDSGYVGDSIFLNGTAIYDGNQSTPAEYSDVTLEILGTEIEIDTTTDINGNFSIELVFNSPREGFIINITVSNRTLEGHDQVMINIKPLFISYISEVLHLTTCYPSEEIWVNGTAKYNSGKPVANSDVEVRISATLFWSGETDLKGGYSFLINAPEDVGQYDVNVSVENGSMIAYNETSLSVTEKPLPDLVVYSEEITFSSVNTPPLKNDEVKVTVIVHNSGIALAEDIDVSFYFGEPITGQLIGSEIIKQIIKGNTGTADVIWNAINGAHYIWVVVDPLDAIAESLEDNNNGSKSIFVDIDTDGDGIGDEADDDDDNDGYYDEDDAFPLDPAASIDTDGDGKPDDWNPDKTASDSTTGLVLDYDDDGDGYYDMVDAFPLDSLEWVDNDGDGIGNNADLDDDNDTLSDLEELLNGTDPLKPDSDGDGYDDNVDYKPLDPKIWVKPEEDELTLMFILVLIILIVIAIVLILLLLMGRKPGEIPQPPVALGDKSLAPPTQPPSKQQPSPPTPQPLYPPPAPSS